MGAIGVSHSEIARCFFYEAVCGQIPYSRLRHGLLLQSLLELAVSLNMRPLFASNELLSELASFRQTPVSNL
jgi:hypothetical protein